MLICLMSLGSKWCRIDAEVSAFVQSLDVDVLSGADAGELVKRLAATKSKIAAAELALGHRAVSANAHLGSGARNGASWLATATGVSVGSAKESLATAERLSSLSSTE